MTPTENRRSIPRRLTIGLTIFVAALLFATGLVFVPAAQIGAAAILPYAKIVLLVVAAYHCRSLVGLRRNQP